MQNCDCICKWLACVNSYRCKTPNRCLFCPLNGRIRSRRATEGRGCNAELCKNTGLHEYIYHIYIYIYIIEKHDITTVHYSMR